MKTSESIKELGAALAKAQAEMSNPKKTSANPFFKSKYADLSEVLNVSKPILADHGISIIQMPSFEAGLVSVETMLLHESGEYITSTISAPVAKQDAQAIGSAITYCRRYSVAAMCGLAQEDDDGNSAVSKPQPQKQQPLTEKQQHIIAEIIALIESGDSNEALCEFWHSTSNEDKTIYWKHLSTTQKEIIKKACQ